MATGPEHYREAERLLNEQVFRDRTGSTTERSFEETVAAAQVHATLALSAATALGAAAPEGRAWAEVAGTQPTGPGQVPAWLSEMDNGPRHPDT